MYTVKTFSVTRYNGDVINFEYAEICKNGNGREPRWYETTGLTLFIKWKDVWYECSETQYEVYVPNIMATTTDEEITDIFNRLIEEGRAAIADLTPYE